jgi:hypothetical protein
MRRNECLTSKVPLPLGRGEYFACFHECVVFAVCWWQGQPYCPRCGEFGSVGRYFISYL